MIKNNAEVAAKIAAEMNATTRDDDNNESSDAKPLNPNKTNPTKDNDPVVIGGSIVDHSYSVQEDNLQVS